MIASAAAAPSRPISQLMAKLIRPNMGPPAALQLMTFFKPGVARPVEHAKEEFVPPGGATVELLLPPVAVAKETNSDCPA